jgi:hypothetical protein
VVSVLFGGSQHGSRLDKLKKTDRVRVFGRTGTIIDFIPRKADVSDAVLEMDDEVSFEDVTGKILLMQLWLGTVEWGGSSDTERTVRVILCPDLNSCISGSGCVEINSHMVYEVIGP